MTGPTILCGLMALSVVITPAAASAQSAATGSIAGVARDSTGAAAAWRHRRGRQSGPHRESPHRRHRRPGSVQDRRSAARHLHRHLHAGRFQRRQAGRHRADDRVHRDGERRAAGRSLEETVTVPGGEPAGRRAERPYAERPLARAPGCAADQPHVLRHGCGHGGRRGGDLWRRTGCRWHRRATTHGYLVSHNSRDFDGSPIGTACRSMPRTRRWRLGQSSISSTRLPCRKWTLSTSGMSAETPSGRREPQRRAEGRRQQDSACTSTTATPTRACRGRT